MDDFNIGAFYILTAARREAQGFYLRGDDPFNQILLPNAYVPEGFKEGDVLEVFIYLDNEERLIATTLKPKICLLYTSPSPRDATLSRMPSSA